MELESEFDQPNDEVTCIDGEYEELSKEHGIKLKDGLYLQELLQNKGTIFEPLEQPLEEEPHSKFSYFGDKEIMKHLNPAMCAQDEDDELGDLDSKTPFESFASDMEDISGGDLGVFKKVIKQGSGVVVPEGAIVTIHYSAYLEYSDEPFDSSVLRCSPLRTRLQSASGTCSLIPGLELGVKTMRAKEKAHFFVKPEYAYGPMGCQPRIPGNAVILYEVELLDFVDYGAADEFEHLSSEEQKEARFERILAATRSECALGNDNFNRGSYHLALKNYLKGARIMENASLRDMEDEKEQQKQLLKLYSNLSMCYLKKNDFCKVLTFCNKALKIDQDSIKALYRKGVAKTKLCEFRAAYDSLIRAKRLKPNSEEINEALLELDRKKHEMHQRDTILYSRMFQPSSGNVSNVASRPESSSTEGSEDKVVDHVFRNHIQQRLDQFLGNENETNFTYPGELSFSELVVLSDMAEDLGLVSNINNENSKITISKVTK